MTTEITTVDELEQSINWTPLPGGGPAKEFNVSEEFVVGWRGLDAIKSKMEKLQKKAEKWGILPPELKILGEFEEDIVKVNPFGLEEVVGKKKLTRLQVVGDIPHIDGYEFIAKIEHSPSGNIIHKVPNSSIQSLPEIFKHTAQTCDVCHQNRERFNTFILKLTNDDKARFPDKNKGDLLMVGSSCLKRFLPPSSVDILICFAKLIDEIKDARSYCGTDHGDFWRGETYPDALRYHFSTDAILQYVCYAYVMNNEIFVSQKDACLPNKPSTASVAMDMIFDYKCDNWSNKILKSNPHIKPRGDDLFKNLKEWLKTKDWAKDIERKPSMADFFHNLSVIASSDTVNYRNNRFVAQLLNSYLMEQRWEEKKNKTNTTKVHVGKIGELITISLKFKKSIFLPKTTSNPYDCTLYLFTDRDKNDVKWWSSKLLKFEPDKWYEITTVIKSHEVDRVTNQPVTYITTKRGKKVNIRLIS
jgi:hypothetical protein